MKPEIFTNHPRKKNGKITTPSRVTLERNIETILDLATSEEYIYGCYWYQDANAYAQYLANLSGLKVSQVSQVISILSPQVDWETNKRNAAVFLAEGLSCKIFASQKQKLNCAGVLLDAYSIPQKALKTYSFASTIADPDNFTGVVIDRHAIAVAFGYLKATPVSITRSRYLKCAEAYARVATRHGLLPHQVQAITWITYKRIVQR